MKITFNLNESDVYIPSGKVMNIKEKLEWNNLELSKEEIELELGVIQYYQFSSDLNIETLEADLTKEFMNKYSRSRKESYKILAIKNINYLKVFTDKKIDECLNIVEILAQDVINDEKVIQKLEKLNKLKLINS